MEWVESTGSSIDEAKGRALDRLGVHGDDAEFEILADVKTGLFGRVKEEARVRARVMPATPRAKDEGRRSRGRGGRSGGGGGGGGRNRNRGQGTSGQGGARQGDGRQKSQKSGGGRSSGDRNGGSRADSGSSDNNGDSRSKKSDNRSAKARGEKREKTMNDDEAAMPLPEQADIAEEFVRGLAERFGRDVEFSREDIDEEEIRITVSGDDLGRMIGRRGTTAGAIDELVRTVLQRRAGSGRNGRIRVDVGGVRARRAEALAKFSRAQADEVRSSGTARSLEPMSAADRKVVHDALSDEDGIDTVSEGEDSRRRVVIVPTGAGD